MTLMLILTLTLISVCQILQNIGGDYFLRKIGPKIYITRMEIYALKSKTYILTNHQYLFRENETTSLVIKK